MAMCSRVGYRGNVESENVRGSLKRGISGIYRGSLKRGIFKTGNIEESFLRGKSGNL